MEFEDIAFKYSIVPEIGEDLEYTGRQALLKFHKEKHIFIGAFDSETMARNVALALEFYKEQNMTSEAKHKQVQIIQNQINEFWEGDLCDQAGALETVYMFLRQYFPREFPSND
jgi:hypothetical protein